MTKGREGPKEESKQQKGKTRSEQTQEYRKQLMKIFVRVVETHMWMMMMITPKNFGWVVTLEDTKDGFTIGVLT